MILHLEENRGMRIEKQEDGVYYLMCDALKELFADELAEGKKLSLKEGLAIGRAEGLKEGIAEGRAEGHATGIQLAKKVFKLFNEGILVGEIAQQCDISEAEVKEILDL